MHKFAFVLEQTLGHVSHRLNLERALRQQADIDATVIRLEFPPPRWLRPLPGLRNWSLRASLASRRALVARLHQGPLDGIFIHTQVASLLSTSIMRSIPTVLSLDATPINLDNLGMAYRHRRGSRVAEAVKHSINRRAFNAARALVTWSGWAAESLQRDYGVDARKIHVVRPGVDLSLFRPDDDRPSNAKPRVLFVGGDFARKGGFELVEAVRSLAGAVELDVVSGSAPDLAANGIRVHRGLAPQSSRLLDLFSRADIFVLPTRGDTLGLVIEEAMASGLPVIATAVGGIPELVRPGVNGWLVPPANPLELARALESLIADARLRQRFGQASLALARAEHDALRNNRRLFEVMAGLVNAPRSAVA